MIYLITDGRFVKIGKANNVAKRLGELQTGNAQPLRVLAVANGSFEIEQHLHTRFARLRARGEWFRLRWWHLLWVVNRFDASLQCKHLKGLKRAFGWMPIFWGV